MKRPAPASDRKAPIRKQRNILFAKFPPDQVPAASDFLGRIEQLEVEQREQERAVGVAYDLHQHSLQELEGTLEDQGYHLDNTLLTGHTGYVVAEVFPLAYGEALENIKGWLGGKPTRVIG